MQPAGGKQTLDDTHLFCTYLAPAEQPVLAPHGDQPQGPLQVVGVDGHHRVTQIGFQLSPVVLGIHQRLGQGITVDQGPRKK